LPKRLRRLFVPLPDAVDRIMDGLGLYQGSLYEALERTILRNFQVTIKRADWQIDNLPSHLRMRFQLLNQQGKVVFTSRSFQELAAHCHSSPPARSQKSEPLPEQHGITDWQFPEAPRPIPVPDKKNNSTTLYYPTLYAEDGQQSLILKYIADPVQAMHQNAIGLRLLYSLQFPREIKALGKECRNALKTHFASWVSLGIRATAAETSAMLCDCILDGLFQIRTGELPDTAQYNHTIQRLKTESIIPWGRRYLQQILELLAVRRKTQLTLTRCRERAQKSKSYDRDRFDHFQKLLDQLLPRDFLNWLTPEKVTERQRYLRALEKRIERAEHAPAKDSRKEQRLRTALERLQLCKNRKNTSPSCREAVSRYEQMVEEFRVSLFAPELGTAFPISEKRHDQQWHQLENSCHTVES